LSRPPERTVVQAPRFGKAKRRLPATAQLEVDEVVKRIITDPLVGEPKVGALKGVRVVKFKIQTLQLLLAYQFDASETSSKSSTSGRTRTSTGSSRSIWMRDERRTPAQTSSIDCVASAFEELVRIQRHDRFMAMVRGEPSPCQAQTQRRPGRSVARPTGRSVRLIGSPGHLLPPGRIPPSRNPGAGSQEDHRRGSGGEVQSV